MSYLKKNEKLLKRYFKKKKSITLALLVSFLISGGTAYAEEMTTKRIEASSEEIKVSKHEDKLDAIEIDIKKSENGVSHNKFKKFSLDKGDIAILKNNKEKETSKLLELEFQGNKNFNSERDQASLIIAEVEKSGGNKTTLAGNLEVLGKTADLVIANENGIEVNGQRFVNTNSVTLTTGKYQGNISKEDVKNIDKLRESFVVNGGEVSIDGTVGLKDTKYFNVLANFIKVNENANIGNKDGIGMNTDKDLEVGLYSENKKVLVTNETGNQSSSSAGIEALGSMYANRIILKTFGENSKITTDKMITGKEEIEIDSKTGLITLGGKIQSKNINITTASHNKNNWDKDKDGKALQISEEIKISADELSMKSKNINDIHNSGSNIEIKNALNLIFKDRIENAESLAKKIEKGFQNFDSTLLGAVTSLEEFLDPARIKVKKINITAGGETYSISTERKTETTPWTPLAPAKEVISWTPLVPAKEVIPWAPLIPAEKINGKINNIEVSDRSKTHLLKVEGEDKATIINIADLSKREDTGDNKISHNKYKKFSIKKEENVLLNNQTKGNKSKSKLLNKEIEGNTSLSEAAGLIINEVENNNQETTELAGGLEVLGNRADLVIANENGIVINGGKFENIGNLDLSTGKYKDFYGNTNLYENRKGDIIVNSHTNFSDVSALKLYGKNLTLNDGIIMNNSSESLKRAKIEAEIDEKILNKKEIKAKDITFKFKKLENQGEVLAKNLLELEADKIVNESKIEGSTLKIKKATIENKDRAILSGNTLDFNAKEIINKGEIIAKETLKINLSGNLTNESFREKKFDEETESGLIKSTKKLEIKAKNIKNIGKDSFGKIVTEDELKIDTEKLENTNSILFSEKDMNIKATGDINNTKHATIQSHEKMNIRAKTILNEASTIKSRSEVKIFTDHLKNHSIFKSSLKEVESPSYWIRKIRIKESWIKSWFNGYSLTLRLNKKQMNVEVDDSVLDSGDSLSIYGFKYDDTKNTKYDKNTVRTIVENRDGMIRSRKNMLIDGEVQNLTSTATMKSDDLLSGILVDLDWNTSSLVENRIFHSGNDGERITLKEALEGKINLYNGAYYRLLRDTNIPEIDRILNLALGGDWKSREQAPSTTTGGEIRYYSKDKRATISSGGNIKINGKLTNSAAADFLEQSDGRKIYVDPKVPVEYELATIGAEGVTPQKEKIEIHEQINHDVKKAKDFLSKENGIYKRMEKDSKYEYVTSDFISSGHKYKGYEYLNSKLEKEYKMEKETKVIGDDYYQHNVIMNMFKSSEVLPENATEEKVETLLENASKEAGRLNLKMGTPLTNEQKKNLKEHIVWYVESEVNERKVLVPVVYTSKTKLAEEVAIAEQNKSQIEDGKNDKSVSEIEEKNKKIETLKLEEEKEKKGKDPNKFKGLSSIEAEKNIEIETEEELVNADSDIYAGGAAKFSVKNLQNRNTGHSSANIVAKEKLEIESKEKVELDFSSLEGKEGVDITAKDINIKASNVESGKGKVNIKAKNSIDIEDKKQKESSYEFTNTGGYTYNTLEEETTYKEKSEASVLKGKDISIESEADINIRGSKLQAENHVDLEAENINILNSTSKKIEESKIRKNGFEGDKFDLHSDTQRKKGSEEVNKNSIEGNTFDIRARKDITIEGSDLKSKEKGKLSAKEKLSIENVTRKSQETLSDIQAKAVSWSSTDKFVEKIQTESSVVDGGNLLEANAKEIQIKGSNLKAEKGEIKASKKVEFEAAAETYVEKSLSGKLGFFGNASVGGLGIGAEASFDTTTNEAKAEVINDYDNKEVRHKKSKLPALVNTEAGIKANVTIGEKDHKTWKNSQLNFGEEGLDISSKNTVDLGGADIELAGDLNVEAKEIKTTKAKNVYKEKEDSIDLALKQKASVSSSILDAANTAKEITEDAEDGKLNEGLAVAKVVGSATNLIFNDAIGANSTQAISFSHNHTESSKEEEVRNKIHVKKNLNFKTTDGAIELNNLDAKIEGKAKLDAEGKLKLKGGEKKVEKTGYGFNLEGRSTQTAGVSVLFGANSQIGVGGTIGANYENFEGLYHDRTNFKANEIETESKDSTELEGAEIRADKKASIKSGKDLKITSQVDKYSGVKAKASVGLNVSVGGASNTVLAGRIGGSASGGAVYENGEDIKEQSGISTGEEMNVNVKNNLDLDAAIIGADSKIGKLQVGKEITKKDRETEEQSGGGFYGASGGLSGEFGFDAEVGDQKNKKELSKSIVGFDYENVVSETIMDSGKRISKEELESDLSKSKELLKDSFKKGGTASGSFSVKDSKKIVEKVKNTFKSAKNNTFKNNTNLNDNEHVSTSTEESNIQRNLVDNDNNDLVNRKLPSLPGENGKEKIYEDIDALREIRAVEEDPYSVILDKKGKESESENPYETVSTRKKEVEDIYAKIDLSKKTSKVETPEEKSKKLEEERTEKYGAKKSIPSEENADYMTVKRVKDKSAATENFENKGFTEARIETKVESIDKNDLVNRKLPSLPRENGKEKIYEDIDTLREIRAVEEDPYSVILDKKGKESKAENPYSTIEAPTKPIAALEQKIQNTENQTNSKEEGGSSEGKTFKNATETGMGNTEYIPKKISPKKQQELENKAKKANKNKIKESEFTDSYNKFRKDMNQKIFDILATDPEFKKLMNSDLNGDTGKIKDLIETVTRAKKNSFEGLGETNFPKAELRLKEPIPTSSRAENQGAQNVEILNNILKQYTYRSGEDYAQNLFKKVAGEKVEEITDGTGNTNYTPKKFTVAEKKALFNQAKQKAKEKDSAKVAEEKLALIADNSKSIPKEHLLKSLKELAYGLSLEDASSLRKKSQETGTKINRPDVIEGFEGKNVKNMGKIFKNIEFDQDYIKIRENINSTIVDKLDSNEEFHNLMKSKLSGNEEGIKKLFYIVEKAKREALKEVTGIEGKKADININTESGPLSMKQGYYNDDVVNMNVIPIISFLRTKKQNNKEVLDTIVHELTHHDQAQITRNKNKDIPESMKVDADLMALNETYYINSDLNTIREYKKQPLEREAFFSGHRLGEQLSKLVDKGYSDKSKQIETIEHVPNVNKNLEAPKEQGTDLGNNALIYGLKKGREELIHRANDADKEKSNAILADSYVGDLNLGYEFSRLSEFAKKVKEGKVIEQDIENIAKFKDPGAESALPSSSRSRINQANEEDNKKIITELLKNEVAVDALKKMDDLNQKGELLLQELKKNEYVDIDNPKSSPSFTEDQNKTIDEYNEVKNGLNKVRMDFFSEKTKLIAKETLERGGQIYFALDGLVTDTMKYNKDKTKIDFDNLKKLWDPSYEYYDAVTSHELRYLYENFRDNPNLKFTIKDQVIENPLKKLQISK